MEALLQGKERELARMIKEAKEQTRNAQLRRLEGQMTKGTGYKVGDLVRIKLDSNEIKRWGKKLAKVYSEKYMVYEVIGGGWTYRLKPHGRRGRNKVVISTTSKMQQFLARKWKVVMKRYLLK